MVKPVPNTAPGTDVVAVVAFQQQTAELLRRLNALGAGIGRTRDQLRHMRAALVRAPRADPALYVRIDSASRSLAALELRLFGHPVRQRLSEADSPSIAERLGMAAGAWESRQTPTATMRRDVDLAAADFEAVRRELAALVEGEIGRIRADLEAAGAPYTPGQRP